MEQEIVVGAQPIKHNVYNRDDFFKFAVREGTIHTRNGLRTFLASEDFVVGLQQGLETEVGDASAMILYKCGFKWGLQDMKFFVPMIESEFGQKLNEMNAAFFLEQWWWQLQAEGWGAWKVDTSQRKQGMIFIDLYDSAIAKSLERVGKPVCHVYAGLFAGVFTYLTKYDLSGIEVQCYAMGEDFCKFIVGAEKRINAAEFWHKEGASAAEIIEKLSD
ncbi:MAG: 4-vinyl reductase [Blastocatellia bacterium]|nr:4-vinyl reductase [Blastocatellia bacterium]